MFRYLLKRLVLSIPLLLFVSFLTLALMHLIPGNYFDSLRLNPQISKEVIQKYEESFHLDKPFVVQYLHWLRGLVRFDFGYSFAYRQPVTTILASRLWNTFLLSASAVFISWAVAVFLGTLAALHRNRLLDRFLCVASYWALSFPNFFLCLILLFLASRFTGLPLGGMKSVGFDEMSSWEKLWDVAAHLLIPVSVLAASTLATLFRLMRSQMIEVLEMDFVLYLRSTGISERKVFFKHALRNAINPMVTLFGLELPGLFSGAALVEIFTGWPGLGQIMLQAVRMQDMFLVMGNMVMISFLLMVGNLISDLSLAAVDPRIRMK